MSAEYIVAHGNPNVILCERGIRTFETATRNTCDIAAVAVLNELTHLPVILDPSHATGKRSLVPALSRAAVAIGADGIIVEVHPNPAKAISDGAQSLDVPMFRNMMREHRSVRRRSGVKVASANSPQPSNPPCPFAIVVGFCRRTDRDRRHRDGDRDALLQSETGRHRDGVVHAAARCGGALHRRCGDSQLRHSRKTGRVRRLREEPEYKNFVEQTGFDYKRDLDRVMVNSARQGTDPLLPGGRSLRLGQAHELR